MSQAQAEQFGECTGDDLRWLDAAFALAQNDSDVQGVVIDAQTNGDGEMARRTRRATSPSCRTSPGAQPRSANRC